MIAALALAAVFFVAAMAAAWAVQRRTGNSGWIDAIWTFTVGLATLLSLVLLPGDMARRIVVGVLILLWSLRLGLHIVARTRKAKDDPRYAKLMEEWGDAAPLRLFLFLQVQALAGTVLVLAATLAATSSAPTTSIGTLAFAALALAALAGEALADTQLAACKRARPANGICEGGLWGYSRHPNYFFEWLFWLAIACLAIAPPTHAGSFAAVLAPIMMYVLLRHGSGVPHLEAHMQRTRPQAFADYARRVPVFFPRLWW